MLTLYQFPTSPFCEKARRILNFKGIDFAIVDVPRREVENYKAISGTGKFPAIEFEGTTVFDSTDVAYFIESRFPSPPLIPEDAHQAAMVHVLEDWADESLYFYELVVRIAWRHNFEKKTVFEFLPTMPWMDLKEAVEKVPTMVNELVTRQGLGRKPVDMIVKDIERHFQSLAGFVAAGDWLVGKQISLADIAVAAQVRAILYAEEAQALLTRFPAVAQWLSRVDSVAPDRPAAQPA